ncbi:MAG: hypothetical protein KDB17_18440 [Ilumatobacter sp.]|nr:hypothetical protein [Ilumatobacter sp.]
MNRRTIALVAVPILGLAAGSGAAYWQRDQPVTTAGRADGTGGREVTAAALDRVPTAHLPVVTDPAAMDLTTVIGYPNPPMVDMPPATALVLSPGVDGLPAVIDPATGQPAATPARPPLLPVAPVVVPALGAPADEPQLADQGDNATEPTSTTPIGAFVDECLVADDARAACSGQPATVAGGETDPGRGAGDATAGGQALQPLTVTYPFAAAAGLAAMCEDIERGVVADPQLAPATRPTVAVLVNQPASLALTGTWADGTPIDKTTMLTLPDHQHQWQEQWDAGGGQGRILACLTFPLEVARAHAVGGRAGMNAQIVAISTNGNTEITGALTLEVPLDGDDSPFVESLSVRGLGEQLAPDGRRLATVAVHYALDAGAVVPPGTTLDPGSTVVQDVHAFVENADCSGWAVTFQGQDRTYGSRFGMKVEQRTISGRDRTVIVVDGTVQLDPNQRGGWEGYLCLHLRSVDRTGTVATLALRGVAVRAPRAAAYELGAGVDGALPAGWGLDVTWAGADGVVFCGPARLGAAPAAAPDTTGGSDDSAAASADDTAGVAGVADLAATCSTLARLHPAGVMVSVRPTSTSGEQGAPITVLLPVNTSYCNPDNPHGAAADGCDTGARYRYRLPLGLPDDDTTYILTVTALRTAGQGQLMTNPSNAWRIDPPQAFRA